MKKIYFDVGANNGDSSLSLARDFNNEVNISFKRK
jgi:hypothetical protein